MKAKLSQREVRHTIHERLDETGGALNQLLHNERIAREKITGLETWAAAWQAMTFWQRLRWIIRGV